MTVDGIAKNIQKDCDKFIQENSEGILNSIEKNIVPITTPYSGFKINELTKKSWGVYVFYIKFQKNIPTLEELNSVWQTNSSDIRLHSPKAIKGKFQPLTQNKWYCFYIGKSENLSGRISQHIHQETAYTTYGLKISVHDRLHNLVDFAYSNYIVKENPLDNKDGFKCLIVTLEKYLRSQLKPLVGKQ